LLPALLDYVLIHRFCLADFAFKILFVFRILF
jgi:hypothetical protein